MSWTILLIISILSSSILTVLQRRTLREEKSNPVSYAIFFQLLVGIILGIAAIATKARFPDNLTQLWPNILLMVALYSFANIYWFKSLKTVEASSAAIFLPTKIFWMVLGGAIFLHENITVSSVIGTFLISGAILITTFSKKYKIGFNKGSITLLVASFFYGFAFVNDGYLLKNNFNTFLYSSMAFLLPALSISIFQIHAVKNIRYFLATKRLTKILVVAMLISLGTVSIYFAYQKGGNISRIGPLSQISIILTVILGIIFLNEKDKIWQKIIGAVISIVGVILIIS